MNGSFTGRCGGSPCIHPFSHSFIHPSSNTSWNTCHAPGPVLSTTDTGLSTHGLPRGRGLLSGRKGGRTYTHRTQTPLPWISGLLFYMETVLLYQHTVPLNHKYTGRWACQSFTTEGLGELVSPVLEGRKSSQACGYRRGTLRESLIFCILGGPGPWGGSSVTASMPSWLNLSPPSCVVTGHQPTL